jgi:UrcA family protein
MSRLTILAAVIGFALTNNAGPAQAAIRAQAPGGEVNKRTLQVADLDVSSPSGAKRLARRINAAAHAVCGQDDGRPRTISDELDRTTFEYHRCVRDAMARAGIALDALMAAKGSPSVNTRREALVEVSASSDRPDGTTPYAPH